VIYTARQLEQLHKANGHVTLPYNARLTPAAHDWVRARKLAIHLTDGEPPPISDRPRGGGCARCNSTEIAGVPAGAKRETESSLRGTFLWWCDGPCGAAKAAILAHTRETNLLPVEVASAPSSTAATVKHVALEVKSSRVTGAILAVERGAAAMVMANRCASLRAVLGTGLDSVDQAVRRVGANVLVLEHAHRTMNEMCNMIRRFTSAQSRTVPDEVERQLRELASCA
jgi:ribose 5-phosphate isomerase RpiB